MSRPSFEQTCHACGGPWANDSMVITSENVDVLRAVVAKLGKAEALLALEKVGLAGVLGVYAPDAKTVTVQGCRIEGGSLLIAAGEDATVVNVSGNHCQGGGIVLGSARGVVSGNVVTR